MVDAKIEIPVIVGFKDPLEPSRILEEAKKLLPISEKTSSPVGTNVERSILIALCSEINKQVVQSSQELFMESYNRERMIRLAEDLGAAKNQVGFEKLKKDILKDEWQEIVQEAQKKVAEASTYIQANFHTAQPMVKNTLAMIQDLYDILRVPLELEYVAGTGVENEEEEEEDGREKG